MSLNPVEALNIWANYSWQEGIIEQPGVDAGDTLGKEIDHIPSFVISGGIDYQFTSELSGSIWAYAQDDYFLEKTNSSEKFGDFFSIDLSLHNQVTKEVGLDFQVKNLTDEFKEYAWTCCDRTFHSPGDERAFYGAVNIEFD